MDLYNVHLRPINPKKLDGVRKKALKYVKNNFSGGYKECGLPFLTAISFKKLKTGESIPIIHMGDFQFRALPEHTNFLEDFNTFVKPLLVGDGVITRVFIRVREINKHIECDLGLVIMHNG